MATIGVLKVQRTYQMSQIRFIWLLPNGISNTFSSHAAFSEQTNFKGPCRTVRNPQPRPSVILLVTALFYHNSRSRSVSRSLVPSSPSHSHSLTARLRGRGSARASQRTASAANASHLVCLKIISQNNFSLFTFRGGDREDSPHPVNL